jgi:hypothetical protein
VGQTVQIWGDNTNTDGALSYTGGLSDSNGALTIGAFGASDLNLTGRVDAVGVWKKAFTSAERTEFHNAGTALEYPFSTGTFNKSLINSQAVKRSNFY